jgi:hypothetical protein
MNNTGAVNNTYQGSLSIDLGGPHPRSAYDSTVVLGIDGGDIGVLWLYPTINYLDF